MKIFINADSYKEIALETKESLLKYPKNLI